MKLTLTLLLFAALAANAGLSYSQTARINLKMNNATLVDVFREIERTSEFGFFFKNEEMDLNRKVSIDLKNATIEQILGKILVDNYDYRILDKNIVVTRSFLNNTEQQQKTVSGKVTELSGDILPGVSVILKGTTIGTITDNNGNYSLNNVPSDAILVFSFIGMKSQDIIVGNKTSINVTLESETIGIEEVVAIGYGTMKKKDLTGSVSTISSESLKDLIVTTVDQTLTGKLAGVQVLTTTGEPGVSTKIRIRGVGSISAGSDPLYVIDGFPTDNIQMLNPNDIETIDVLKDASATAIYGSRGANGVVLIKTKRGKAGSTVIGFDTYMGWQKILKVPEFLDVKEQALYYYYGIENQNLDKGKDVSGDPTKWTYNVPVTIMDVLEGRNTTNSEAYDAIFQTASQQSYNLSAKGGNEGLQYSVSGEYLDQDGIVKSSNFKRYSARMNLDAKLSKKLSMKLNYNTAYSTTKDISNAGGPGGGEGIIGSATTWQHYYPLFNEDGTYFSGYGQDATNNVWNPVAQIEQIKRSEDWLRTMANLNTEYKFSNALSLNVMLGANFFNRHYYSFIPKIPVFSNVTDGSDVRASSLNWITESTLNYNKSIKKHNISGLIGYTTQRQKNGGNFVRSRDYPNNLVYTLNAVSNILYQGNSEESEWSLISYLTRVNYNYDSKYYVTTSVRSDGSSRFGRDNKYGYFPSAALAWRISSEDFLKDVSFINDFKIRISYGETGNNNIGNYAHIGTINYESYPYGGSAVGGYAPAQFANSMLTWEKQRSFNTGIDVSMFENRLSFSADYFNSTNHNLLLNVYVPLTTGFNTSLENIGEVENKGWETTISTKNLIGRFKWTTDFNISAFKNKVLQLGPEGAPIISESHITQVGQPMGMFYGYKLDGVFMTQAELNAGPIYGKGTVAQTRLGDVRFKDISGPDGVPDGLIDSNDKKIVGSPYPDFYYGMTNSFSYKNFSLVISVQGSQGSEVMNTNDYLWYTRARYKQFSAVKNYWKSEADPGDGVSPRPNNSPTGGVRERSDRQIDTGSFFKINNINFSYAFSNQIAHKLSLGSLRVYMTATNPLLITKFKNFNPEVSTNSDPLQPGIFDYNYPIAKSLSLGLNVTF